MKSELKQTIKDMNIKRLTFWGIVEEGKCKDNDVVRYFLKHKGNKEKVKRLIEANGTQIVLDEGKNWLDVIDITFLK
jgi:hypothetical protein